MQENLNQEILQRIDALAQKLGTTADYLWPILVREQYAVGLAGLAMTAGSVLVTATAAWFMARSKTAFFNYEGGPRPRFFGVVALGFALLVAVLSLASLPADLAKVVAPEAAALRSILPN
jgi:hypothetical protein